MFNRPTTIELVRSVREHLETTMSELRGRDAFMARVASNVLRIVEREMTDGASRDEHSQTALCRLLGQERSLPELERELCNQIRNRRIGLDEPSLVRYLRESTERQLAIDNPKYLERARQRRG